MQDHKKTITIALDVMGADVSPGSIVAGGLMAAEALKDRLRLVLVGKREVIAECIGERKSMPPNVAIEHAAYAIAMGASPTEAMRKKTSSIAVGLNMQHEGKADAFVSAGNTGAVMASSIMTLGRIEGVLRPAIATLFPTLTEHATLVLDVGANVDCKPSHIFQFGLMGSVYASLMSGRTSPRVGLLSIGTERSKGNDQILQTRELFEKSGLNYIGFVEGGDILSGKADVVATDGFVGNILLKFTESIEGFLTNSLRRQIETNIFSRVGAGLMTPFLRRQRNSFDYSEYGGAPLMGVNGVCIICHGSSSQKAIKNAILVAARMVRHRISENIKEEMAIFNNGNTNEQDAKGQNNGNRVVPPVSSSD
jgi:glycerol-3-phosphate acyltransferase PlsX